MNSREKHIDTARGIAILCIIIGHLGVSKINQVVFTFHVPIFFLITGYFLSSKESIKEFSSKRFRTLIVPYYLTCLIMILLGTALGFLSNGIDGAGTAMKNWIYASLYGAGDSYKEPFVIKSIGAIWFLWASFWGSIFLRLSLTMKPLTRIGYIIALFLLGYYSRGICWFPLSIQAGCCATLWMYFGWLYKKSKSDLDSLSDEARYAVLLFAAVVWVFFIRDFKSFWLVHCDVGRGIIDIFGSLCASYVVIQISKWLTIVPFIGDCLAFLGRYSLFMLCFHILELNLFPWDRLLLPLNTANVPAILIILTKYILKCFLIITFTVISSRNTMIKQLFGMTKRKLNKGVA